MKIKLATVLCALLSCGILSANVVGQQAHRVATKPAPPKSKSIKKIGYQAVSWQTKHLHNPATAEQTLKDLRRIGCEVIEKKHGNHIDVRYRCSEWKMLTLETDAQVEQWRVWLAKNGLETVVLNPPKNSKLATVRYRLPDWASAHLHDTKQAETVLNMLQLLGCEVSQKDHNGHIDANFRCRAWTVIALPSDHSAHQWQAWLKENGFETQHSH